MLTLMLGISACVDVDITTPHGPKGPKGPDGASDYDLWKQEVEAGRIEWDKEKLALTDFFKFLKGNDGQDGTNGTDGKDGKSAYELWKEKVLSEEGVENPHNKGNKWSKDETSVPDFWRYLTGGTGEVGQVPQIKEDENGVPYWYVGDDKIRKATGEDGDPGDNAVPPTISIIDGFWAVDGVKTDKTATPTDGTNGKPGKTPTVDINPTTGNWILNGEETNTSAKGQDGQTPVVTIDPKSGEWKIDGRGTGKTAFGQKGLDGDNGQDGKSAYELWKEEVEKGNLKDHHSPDPNTPWPREANTPQDFWDYLVGGEQYTVKITYAVSSFKDEFVNPYNGEVYFQIFDSKDKLVSGTVSNISPINPTKEFKTTSVIGQSSHLKTHITLPKEELTDFKKPAERTMYPKVKINGKARLFTSTKPVVVPNKVHFRATIVEKHLKNKDADFPYLSHGAVKLAWRRSAQFEILFKLERQVDGEWGPFPRHMRAPWPNAWLTNQKKVPTPETATTQNARKIRTGGISPYENIHFEREVYRTIELTNDMVNAYTNGTEEQKEVLKDWYLWDYRGDDEWKYLVFAFGDDPTQTQYINQGDYDYGEYYVVPELIHYPAVKIAPGLNHSKLYIDKTTNSSNPILWGEVDHTMDVGVHYPAGSYNKDSKYTKTQEDGVTIWKQAHGPKPKEKAISYVMVSLVDPQSNKKDVETSITKYRIYDDRFTGTTKGKNFYLKQIKDGYYIATNFSSNSPTPSVSEDYFGTVRYKIKHDANTDKWSLINFWKPDEVIELQEKEWPGEEYYKGNIDENKKPYTSAP